VNQPYIALKVKGMIPPPAAEYAEFYNTRIEFRERFPRLAPSADVSVEVFLLDAPILRVAVDLTSGFGGRHSGVGFLIRDRKTGRELFRSAFQFWPCMYDFAQEPVRDGLGALELQHLGRMEWRARGAVTGSKTLHAWHGGWAVHVSLGTLGAAEFDATLEFMETWAQEHVYFQWLRVYERRGTLEQLVLPDVSSNTFVHQTILAALGLDLRTAPGVRFADPELVVSELRTVRCGEDGAAAIREPHGQAGLPEDQWTPHRARQGVDGNSIRLLWRAAQGLTWSMPIWYTGERRPAEVPQSDFPHRYWVGRITEFRMVSFENGHRAVTAWSPYQAYSSLQIGWAFLQAESEQRVTQVAEGKNPYANEAKSLVAKGLNVVGLRSSSLEMKEGEPTPWPSTAGALSGMLLNAAHGVGLTPLDGTEAAQREAEMRRELERGPLPGSAARPVRK